MSNNLHNKDKLLYKHLELVLDANKKTNLTNITDFNKATIYHIEDSLSAKNIIDKLPNGKLVDLGSGAGFPGIPLAITTNREVLLTETTKKKADWLKIFIERLNLKTKISVYNGRIEDLSKEMPETFMIATARALSSLNSLLELASPLLKIGGYLICYKSDNITEEINTANNISDKLGFEDCLCKTISLSNNIKRRLVIYKKTHKSTVKLPRKLGFAQKKPFK